ncbi:MAG: hypothetical protein EBQ92_05865 [Proteobacteria bacterium]|nr:hypothetical protein [Pseudomonadota bacterium]
MIWLYRLIYPFFIACLWLVSLFSKKIRQGLVKRIGLAQRLALTAGSWRSEERKLWFHFSSAGEFEQVLPVIDTLQQTDAKCRIVLTYFSPSAERAIHSEAKRRTLAQLSCPWDFADYSPFDFHWSVSKFLNVLNPSCFVAVHRELWPEVLFQCGLRKIPCFLIGAFFPSSFKSRSGLTDFCLKHLDKIAAVDENTRTTLLGVNPALSVEVLGDPRIERVLFRKHHFSKSSDWKTNFKNQQVFIGASLWDEDFEVLLRALPGIRTKAPHARIVIVPHEPIKTRVNAWQEALKNEGCPVRTWDEWNRSPDSSSHLIVDTVGILAELYSISTCVFVGGSFKKRVHNVLEPLVYSCGIVTGPFIHNSSEASELAERHILRVVHTPAELSQVIGELLTSTQKQAELAEKAKIFLSQKEGVSKSVISMILDQ